MNQIAFDIARGFGLYIWLLGSMAFYCYHFMPPIEPDRGARMFTAVIGGGFVLIGIVVTFVIYALNSMPVRS